MFPLLPVVSLSLVKLFLEHRSCWLLLEGSPFTKHKDWYWTVLQSHWTTCSCTVSSLLWSAMHTVPRICRLWTMTLRSCKYLLFLSKLSLILTPMKRKPGRLADCKISLITCIPGTRNQMLTRSTFTHGESISCKKIMGMRLKWPNRILWWMMSIWMISQLHKCRWKERMMRLKGLWWVAPPFFFLLFYFCHILAHTKETFINAELKF